MQSPIIAFVTWGSDDTYTHAFNSGEALQVKELYDKKPQDKRLRLFHFPTYLQTFIHTLRIFLFHNEPVQKLIKACKAGEQFFPLVTLLLPSFINGTTSRKTYI